MSAEESAQNPNVVAAAFCRFVSAVEARSRSAFPRMVRAEMRRPSDVPTNPLQDAYASCAGKLTDEERVLLLRLIEKMYEALPHPVGQIPQ